MLTVKRVLCPTDMSEPSRHALAKAAEIARQFDAELVLLHVLPVVPLLLPGPGYAAFPVEGYERALEAEAEKRLDGLTREIIPEGIRCRRLMMKGDAASQIMLAADEEKVDLIVIATHGMTGWHHFVFGSVTEKVVRLAHCPVLTLRTPRKTD
jgi:nucleotide-binding universal stress UspA family protein